MENEYILVFRVENKNTKERIVEMMQTPVRGTSREHIESAFLTAARLTMIIMENAGILPKYDPVKEVLDAFSDAKPGDHLSVEKDQEMLSLEAEARELGVTI